MKLQPTDQSARRIVLKGIAASSGVATGKVRIVLCKEDFSSFQNGEVLVAKITDPSYVVIMSKASAIVSDIGGVMSHPAIVSREFGIPCVVATKEATTILQNGQMIEVDGTNGVIYAKE